MTLLSRRRLCVLSIAALAGPSLGVQAAETFPDKPVRLIVAFPAGGSADVYARLLGRDLSVLWKQPVIVDNRPGASGNIALQAMLSSPRDGYTYVLVSSSFAFNPLLNRNLPYTDRDFRPVINLVSAGNVLIAPPSSKYATVKEYLADARAHPGLLSYGMAGAGTTPHLAGELLKAKAKVDIVGVPYKGNMPVMSDVMAGQIPSGIASMPDILPFVKAGKLKALGIATEARSPKLPGVPTIAEAGIPGYESTVWWGIVAPAGVPDEIIHKVNLDMNTVLQGADMRKTIEDQGATVIGGTAEQFAKFIVAEQARMGPTIKSAGIHAD